MESPKHGEAIHFWHDDIDQNEIECAVLNCLQSILPIFRNCDVVPLMRKLQFERMRKWLFILDDEDALARSRRFSIFLRHGFEFLVSQYSITICSRGQWRQGFCTMVQFLTYSGILLQCPSSAGHFLPQETGDGEGHVPLEESTGWRSKRGCFLPILSAGSSPVFLYA